MSRGFGYWQRLILRATEDTKEVIILGDLVKEIPDGLRERVSLGEWLSRGAARSEAIKRAARTLAKKGLIGYGRREKVVAPFAVRYRAAVWWIPEIDVFRRRKTLKDEDCYPGVTIARENAYWHYSSMKRCFCEQEKWESI